MASFSNNLLFDYLKNILQTKSEELFYKHVDAEDFEKQFPRFMVLRYLSMGKSEVAKVILDNQIALERFPNNKSVYRFLLKEIPQQKSAFIKYIK